jgi:calcineurin-like phosphoesterase family protein
MNIHTSRKTSRREFLRVSAGALLAAGLTPGCARFSDAGKGEGDFTFVVINDAHFYTPKCPEFYGRVRESVMTLKRRPEIVLFAGDLSESGSKRELGSMKEILNSFKTKWHAVPGNHDYITQTDRSAYDEILPRSLNYNFEHRGWQFVALDTTEGKKADKTTIQPHTMSWAKANVAKLDHQKPTVIFTHFPLGPTAPKRPLNSDELLSPFLDLNIAHVFGGHHHGFTERTLRDRVFVTNKCCSISRPNHDKTTEKGYFLCSASAGKVTRKFIEVPTA